jgi:hypothetical protein
MAGNIIEKLTKMAEKVAHDKLYHDKLYKEDEEPLGERLAWMAVDAILLGPDSPQWKDYMNMFGPTEEELLRLTLKDSKKNDKVVRRACAYIVSNAVCGTATGTQTQRYVDTAIDEGL